MKKRGLSEIIATVLIILLSIAAVVIIWAFVRKAIEDSSTAIKLSQKCFGTEVEILKCYGLDRQNTRFVLQVKNGAPSEIIISMESEVNSNIESIILTKSDVPILGTPPPAPGTITFTRPWGEQRTINFAQAITIVKDDKTGETRVCDPTTKFICQKPSLP